MRWLLDEMLPRAAVDALNERGHDAVSVVDIDLRTASDDSVYATAVEQARIVVTEDELAKRGRLRVPHVDQRS
ncbi:DUF5615 family PIN-like protein [Candidatus Poriferisodalis sp.]|uniref:DUF5615 family PIN-like protein n=1 Tax=Candidatus Poriferisodalis sp. TaxID=3101277 RepID=UPI003AF8083C